VSEEDSKEHTCCRDCRGSMKLGQDEAGMPESSPLSTAEEWPWDPRCLGRGAVAAGVAGVTGLSAASIDTIGSRFLGRPLSAPKGQ
jgi:hypothetical protein